LLTPRAIRGLAVSGVINSTMSRQQTLTIGASSPPYLIACSARRTSFQPRPAPLDRRVRLYSGSPCSGAEVTKIEMSNDETLTRPEGAPDDAMVWAWATEHSAPERASAQQLISWLARGELAPHTLVWRVGWNEWLPALQVVELAAAFPQVTPGNRRVAQAAPAGSSTPPPVPVGHCPRLRLLARDVVTGSTPFTASSQGLAPARAGRRTLRDLDELQHDVVTSQVPAAAMLEAARAMKALGPARAPSVGERWNRLDLGTFGEPPPPSAAGEPRVSAIPEHPRSGSYRPGRTLSPHALELDFSAPDTSELELPWARPRRYGRWLALGLLVGSALGLIAIGEHPPGAALPAWTRADQTADESPRLPPFRAAKTARVHAHEPEQPALLRALSVTPHEGFDRAVFEFHERVPSFQVDYVDGPSKGCVPGETRTVSGESWLEVRFHPADARALSAELTAMGPEPALGTIREVERTCDDGGVAAWAIGSASLHRFRAFELSAPPRLVVDVEH
jgi:hypothetical protein